jgi:PTS system cellobiose-specific IIC component
VAESFTSLIPAIVLFVFFSAIHIGLGFNINAAISWLLSPIAKAVNTLPGYALYHMLCGLVFFCGINSMVVIGVVMPFVLQFGAANEQALIAGEPLKYAVTWATDSMIWSGGTGATIGLVLLMSVIAKSKYFRTLGRMSLLPGVFNINEPIIFGVPICFNPLFLIPYVLTPGILAASTYAVMNAGFVAMPSVTNLPWTTPPIIIGFLMSNGTLSTTIWSALVVVISLVIFYPFFKIADNQQYQKEVQEQTSEAKGT